MTEITRARISLGQVSYEVEGSEEFVKKELEWFKENVVGKVDLQKHLRPPKEEKKEKLPPDQKPQLKVFMKEKSPTTDMERATVIAYYLKEHESKEEIDGSLLREWCAKAGTKPPKNPAQTLREAKSKHGYFDKGKGKGMYKTSATGRYLVESELPRKRK
ncbi:MAG: hypothetical protein V3U51_01245 [Thermoplasmata archaeon]